MKDYPSRSNQLTLHIISFILISDASNGGSGRGGNTVVPEYNLYQVTGSA